MKYKKLNNKYKARVSYCDNIRFPSMLERNCYVKLKDLQNKGKILFFLRQIPFDLPGGFKHIVDYQVFTEGDVLFIEAKGKELPMWNLKSAQVEEIFNVQIHVAKKPEDIDQILSS